MSGPKFINCVRHRIIDVHRSLWTYHFGKILKFVLVIQRCFGDNSRLFLWKWIFSVICRLDVSKENLIHVISLCKQVKLLCEAQNASTFYKIMLRVTADTADLGINIHDKDWLDILSNVGKNIREARGKFIHYKIVHRCYYTAILLRKGITENNLCWKCKEEEGTFLHIIWKCPLVYPF